MTTAISYLHKKIVTAFSKSFLPSYNKLQEQDLDDISLKFNHAVFTKNLKQTKTILHRLTPQQQKQILNNPPNNYDTALHIAAREGHKKIVSWLLKNGANPTAKNIMDFMPIHLAARYDQNDIAKLLLAQNASEQINAKCFSSNNDNATAEQIAKSRNNKQMVELIKTAKSKIVSASYKERC